MSSVDQTAAATQEALRFVACFAFRRIGEIEETRREAVLQALVEVLPETEAALAERALFYFREGRRAQLELTGSIDRFVNATPIEVAGAQNS